jgi:AhpD family alkylhydroperoxidase
MSRIDVTDDLTSWMQLQPEMGEGLAAFSNAVYGRAKLPLREREIARMRIALINECEVCRNARQQHGTEAGVDETLYAQVPDWRNASGLSAREKLLAEFAERFAIDHVALRADEAFWKKLRASLSDAEIVELSMSCALWLGTGRAMRVLDVGQSCQLTINSPS